MNNWIDDVISEVQNDIETPKSWVWWSLVTAISATAANNYFMVTFNGKVTYKPNLFVILLGDSGLGKAFGITLSKLLVDAANVTRVISGRSTVQGIVKEIGTARTRENGNAPFTDSRAFVVNGELGAAIVTDPDALAILTDLYDGHIKWDTLLKSDGLTKLNNIYVTALFGSSQAHFYDKIPQANIEGGYIGRNLIIYEEKRSQYVNPFGTDDTVGNLITDYIVPKYHKHLIQIASKKGQIQPNSPAKELYNSWRKKFRTTQTSDKTGFLNRVPDHVAKVSMCLGLARYDFDGMINEFDMSESIEKVVSLVYANKMSTESTGLDPMVKQTQFVLNQLRSAEGYELKQRLLLSRGIGMYQNDGLQKILDTLLEMHWIERERISAGKNSDWMIRLIGDPLEAHKKFIREKENKK